MFDYSDLLFSKEGFPETLLSKLSGIIFGYKLASSYLASDLF
jgi:hypothetical protein